MSVDVFSSHMHAERIALDPRRTAVVVVDMINEFCKPGGKMVLPGYEILVPPQLSVIDAARNGWRAGHLGARQPPPQHAARPRIPEADTAR